MHTVDETRCLRRSNTSQVKNVSRAGHLMWGRKLELNLQKRIARSLIHRTLRPRGSVNT